MAKLRGSIDQFFELVPNDENALADFDDRQFAATRGVVSHVATNPSRIAASSTVSVAFSVI